MVAAGGDTTTTIAGGEAGFADGPAAQSKFNAPCGVCAGPDGAVYVADTGNHAIRRIKDGQVSTLAGGPSAANGAGKLGLIAGIAFVRGTNPMLVAAEADGARLLQFSLEGKPL